MRPPYGGSYVGRMNEIAATELQPSRPSAAWLRIVAMVYDPFLWFGERAGMRRRRSTLLHDAVGRVVEIGAGTGLNVEHYPDGVAELLLAEPDPAMRRQLARRVQRHSRAAARPEPTSRPAPAAARRVRGHRRLDTRPLHRRRA